VSTARKTVKCRFGILTMEWRILFKTIRTLPKTAQSVVKATSILHNTIIDKEQITNGIAELLAGFVTCLILEYLRGITTQEWSLLQLGIRSRNIFL
jgi:hypothetical protein